MKLDNIWAGPKTVGEFIELLSEFPADWPVSVATPAGGGIAVEHREIKGQPVVAVFGKNGGRFGENPLTEEEYKLQSERFLAALCRGDAYTSIHGDHRTYSPRMGSQATCYGQHYDRRVVERMAAEALISPASVDIDRVKYLDRA